MESSKLDTTALDTTAAVLASASISSSHHTITRTITRSVHFEKVRSALLLGKEQLGARFSKNSRLSHNAGEMFRAPARVAVPIYRLQSGWACQLSQLPVRRPAIIDVYLPGDIIGLDTLFRTRLMENVRALTSVEAEIIDAGNEFNELMASQCTALYVTWLLGRRQQRTDRFLAAIAAFDARGKLGMMVLDFYKRLRTRKLISAPTYNMPLTQQHIGDYLGLTVVHVNRVLRSLRKDRITSIEKNCVTIYDLERLTQLATERGELTAPAKQDWPNASLPQNCVFDDVNKPMPVPVLSSAASGVPACGI